MTPNVPRDAMPTPVPREQSRVERPDVGTRAARRDTTFDRPAMRERRPDPRMRAEAPRTRAPEPRMSAPQHRAPAPERHAQGQNGRNHKGHGE